jgi:nucleotide-binding universal stress UspA family protein
LEKIFVPVDYQTHTENILEYSVKLAEYWKAQIILFHSFSLPLISAETSYVHYPLEEIYEEDLKELDKLSSKIKGLSDDKISVQYISQPGFTASGILDESEKQKADLIIMSASERTKLGEKTIGSNAVYVARHSKIPVLLLPAKKEYQPIKKILLAIDPEHKFEKEKGDRIKEMRDELQAEIDIISIAEEKTGKTSELYIKEWLKNLEISKEKFHFLKSKNHKISQLINENSIFSNSDLLILFPQKHSLFKEIFSENITRELAYHATIPVMTIN